MDHSIAYVSILILSVVIIILEIKKKKRKERKGKAHLQFVFSFNNQIKIQGDNLMARIKDTQFITVSIKPVDSKGQPAEVQSGSVVFTSSDESVATVTQSSTDEKSATVNPVGVGVCQISCSADADLGEGVTEISGSGALEVVGGDAVSFELTFGEPQDQA